MDPATEPMEPVTDAITPAGAPTASVDQLARSLGLDFKDLGLLSQALVHSSYTNEQPQVGEPNERLEFLGDSVISLIVSEQLWRRHPGEDEGSLTTRRAAIVSALGLARVAERLDLGSYLHLGAGANLSGERARRSILAGVLEAVCGAVYLEFGFERTQAWLLDVLGPELEARRPAESLKAPKSALQELSYARAGRAPEYQVVSEEGPPHNRRYRVEVLVDGQPMGRGEGRNRRDAETEAAQEALDELNRGSP